MGACLWFGTRDGLEGTNKVNIRSLPRREPHVMCGACGGRAVVPARRHVTPRAAGYSTATKSFSFPDVKMQRAFLKTKVAGRTEPTVFN